MIIGFFVNDIEREYANYTTTVLAFQAASRGHRVCYITPSDFVLQADDSLHVHGRFLPKRKYKDRHDLFKALKDDKAVKIEQIDITKIDALMLRNDPSIDTDRPWAMESGVLFGREAVRRGVIVLNDPDSLGRAINKLYFQGFPPEVRAETLITRHASDIKAFAKAHSGNIILKPLQGSGGAGVFKVDAKNSSNLNQMIDAVTRDGYVVAQEYLPAAAEGDVRLFLLNGRPLEVDGRYCAFRRVNKTEDLRSNMHVGGEAVEAKVDEVMLGLAEQVRPRLVQDGMFLVGLDIVGDRLMEVNVFSAGGLTSAERLGDRDFSAAIIEAIERKVAYRDGYAGRFPNVELATL
jgi:glutathione synthase